MSSSPEQRSTSRKRSPPSSSSHRGSANNDNNCTSSTRKKARFDNDDRSSFTSPRKLTYESSSSSIKRSGRLSNGDTASPSSFPCNGNGNDSSYNCSSRGDFDHGRQGYLNGENCGDENSSNTYGRPFRSQQDPCRHGSYPPSHGSGTYFHYAHTHGAYDHHMYRPSPSSYPDDGSIYTHGDRVLPPPSENSNNNSYGTTYARNGHFLSRHHGNSNMNAFGSSFNHDGDSLSPLDSYAQGLSPYAHPIHGSGYNNGGRFAPRPHGNSNNNVLDTTVYSHGEVRSQFSSPSKPMAEFQICSPTPQKNSRSSAVLPAYDQPVGWLLDGTLPTPGMWYDIQDYNITFRETLKRDRHLSQFYNGVLDVDQRRALLTHTEDHLPFDMLSLQQKKRLVSDEKRRTQDRNNQNETKQAASTNNLVLKVLDGGMKERETLSKQGHAERERGHAERERGHDERERGHEERESLLKQGNDERRLVLESIGLKFRNNLNGELLDDGRDDLSVWAVDDGRDDVESTFETTIELEAEHQRPEYVLKHYMCCSDHCPRSLSQEGLSNGHQLLKTAFSGVKNFEGIESSSGFGEALKIVKANVPQMLRPELKTLQDSLYHRPHGVATNRNGSGHDPHFIDLPSQKKFVVNMNKSSEALVAIVNAIPSSKVRASYDNTESVRCVCPPLTKAEDEIDRLRKELKQKNQELQQKDKELQQKDTELQQKDTELVQQNAETERMKQKNRRLTQTLFTDMGPEKAREILQKANQLQKN